MTSVQDNCLGAVSLMKCFLVFSPIWMGIQSYASRQTSERTPTVQECQKVGYSLKVPSRISRAFLPNILMMVATKKIASSNRKAIESWERYWQAGRDRKKILKGIGVNAESINIEKQYLDKDFDI